MSGTYGGGLTAGQAAQVGLDASAAVSAKVAAEQAESNAETAETNAETAETNAEAAEAAAGATAAAAVAAHAVDLVNVADAAEGAALIGYKRTEAGAVGRLLSARLAETVSIADFGAVGDGVTDDSAAVQAALNTGAGTVLFPTPSVAWKFGGITVTTRGQRLVGSGRNTCKVIPTGTACLYIKEHKVEISGFWFRPASVATEVQDAGNTTHVIYTLNNANSDLTIDWLHVCNNHFQDIAAAAIFIKSALRESYIYKNQFRGMGNTGGGIGVIHGALDATFLDSSNYVYVTDNHFYRAETPFIKLAAVTTPAPVERYYDNWHIKNNLFHGQLLTVATAVADPNGPVVGGATHMLDLQSVDGIVIDNNTFTSFKGTYSAIYTRLLAVHDKNGALYVRNNRIFVDNNGSYTGTAVVAADCLTTEVTGNVFNPNFQATQIAIQYSGTFSYTPIIDVAGNKSANQYDVVVTLPASYKAADAVIRVATVETETVDTLTVKKLLGYRRGGRVTLTAGATTAAVTFAGISLANMSHGNYDIYTRCVDQNIASWVTVAGTAGFTINLASNPGTRVVSWFLIDTTM